MDSKPRHIVTVVDGRGRVVARAPNEHVKAPTTLVMNRHERREAAAKSRRAKRPAGE